MQAKSKINTFSSSQAKSTTTAKTNVPTDDRHFIRFADFSLEKFQINVPDGDALGAFTVLDLKTGTMIIEEVCIQKGQLGIKVASERVLEAAGLHPVASRPLEEQTIAQMATYCRQTIHLRLVLFDVNLAAQLKFARFPFLLVADDQPIHLEPFVQPDPVLKEVQLKTSDGSSPGSTCPMAFPGNYYPRFAFPGQPAALPIPKRNAAAQPEQQAAKISKEQVLEKQIEKSKNRFV